MADNASVTSALLKRTVYRNLMKDYLPFPIDRKLCARWAGGIPEGGSSIIYTSMMYQMAPMFKAYESLLPRAARLRGSERLASLGKFLFKPKRAELERAYAILRNIASMLSKSDVDFGYLHEKEPYSGAILIELGMRDEFIEYGKKLTSFFTGLGVERVITVDPHTTNALARMKEYVPSRLEVVNYLSLIDGARGEGKFVLHDSCLYARHLGLRDSIRQSIGRTGISLAEDRMVTGKGTAMCCGSPVGAVSPDLGEKIAEVRARALLSVGGSVMVMCPMCYQALSPHIKGLKDFAEVVR